MNEISGNASHIANINPYKYRGYRYDNKTGLYYLQSRYYNPEWCRFVNADIQLNGSLVGKNLYIYCENNPINMCDPDGYLTTTILGLLVGLGTTAITATGIIVGGIAVATGAIALGWWIGDQISAVLAKPATGSSNASVNNKTTITTSTGSPNSNKQKDKEFEKRLNQKTTNGNKGYNSFSKLKKAVGSAGQGNQWHHIVEQSQIRKSGFDIQMIQNPKNIISVSKDVHRKISGYYNTTTFDFTHGLSVRNWLVGKSYQTQYKFGINVLKMFGGI